ncbi:MAG: hypothetical protein ACOC6C_04125, partial [Verrucomicrobiota bacterium]
QRVSDLDAEIKQAFHGESALLSAVQELDRMDRNCDYKRVVAKARDLASSNFPPDGGMAAVQKALDKCRDGLDPEEDADVFDRIEILGNRLTALESNFRLRAIAAAFGRWVATEKTALQQFNNMRKHLNDWFRQNPEAYRMSGMSSIDPSAEGLVMRCLDRYVKMEKLYCDKAKKVDGIGVVDTVERLKENVRALASVNIEPFRPRGEMRLLYARVLDSAGRKAEAVDQATQGLKDLKPKSAADAKHWIDLAVYQMGTDSRQDALHSAVRAWRLRYEAFLNDTRPDVDRLLMLLGDHFCTQQYEVAQTPAEADRAVKNAIGAGIFLSEHGVFIEEENDADFCGFWPAQYAFFLWNEGRAQDERRVVPLMTSALVRDRNAGIALQNHVSGQYAEFVSWLVNELPVSNHVSRTHLTREWNRLYRETVAEKRDNILENLKPASRSGLCSFQLFKESGEDESQWEQLLEYACANDPAGSARLPLQGIEELFLAFIDRAVPHKMESAEEVCGRLISRCMKEGVPVSRFARAESRTAGAWLAVRWMLRDSYERSHDALTLLDGARPDILRAREPAQALVLLAGQLRDAPVRRAFVILAERLMGQMDWDTGVLMESAKVSMPAVEMALKCEGAGNDIRLAAAAGKSFHWSGSIREATLHLQQAVEQALNTEDVAEGRKRDVLLTAADNFLRRGLEQDAWDLFRRWEGIALEKDVKYLEAGRFISMVMKGSYEEPLAEVISSSGGSYSRRYGDWLNQAECYRLWQTGHRDEAVMRWANQGYSKDRLRQLLQSNSFEVLE